MNSATVAHKAELAQGNYDNAKARLAAKAASGFNAKSIARHVLEVAEAEGARDAWSQLHQVIEADTAEFSQVDLLGYIADLLEAGADDTWSGRGNDINRARFDGVREACRGMKYLR